MQLMPCTIATWRDSTFPHSEHNRSGLSADRPNRMALRTVRLGGGSFAVESRRTATSTYLGASSMARARRPVLSAAMR